MATTQLYTLRQGRLADVPAVTRVYAASFAREPLLDILFPKRHDHASDFEAYLHRLFLLRYWTPTYSLTVLVDDATDLPVGFAWWRKPWSELSFYRRWLSPSTWFAALVRAGYALRNALFPIRSMDSPNQGIFYRVFAQLEPSILNSDRRRQAWYLSLLSVHPILQGRGLGSLLLRDGLQRADAQNRATWLVGVGGKDAFYARHGFVGVARANVGELSAWGGGLVMFRE